MSARDDQVPSSVANDKKGHDRNAAWRVIIGLIRRRSRKSAPIPNVFDKIPPEIIQHVIELCFYRLGEGTLPEGYVISNRHFYLRKYSQVCKRWREICLNTTEWWGYITVENEKLIPVYLKRSQSSPLYIHIPEYWHHRFPYYYYPIGVFNLLVEHISHWKFVQLAIIPGCGRILEEAKRKGRTAPLLERLDLYSLDSDRAEVRNDIPGIDALFEILSSSTNFRQLRMHHLPLPSTSASTACARLTVIKIKNVKSVLPTDIVRFLSMCTSATDVEIEVKEWGKQAASEAVPRIITLPLLTRLHLDLFQIDIGAWLHHLNLPQLKHLMLLHTEGHPYDIGKFAKFMEQSRCVLETLHINMDYSPDLMQGVAGYLALPWIGEISDVMFKFSKRVSDMEMNGVISQNSLIDIEVKERILPISRGGDEGVGWCLDTL